VGRRGVDARRRDHAAAAPLGLEVGDGGRDPAAREPAFARARHGSYVARRLPPARTRRSMPPIAASTTSVAANGCWVAARRHRSRHAASSTDSRSVVQSSWVTGGCGGARAGASPRGCPAAKRRLSAEGRRPRRWPRATGQRAIAGQAAPRGTQAARAAAFPAPTRPARASRPACAADRRAPTAGGAAGAAAGGTPRCRSTRPRRGRPRPRARMRPSHPAWQRRVQELPAEAA